MLTSEQALTPLNVVLNVYDACVITMMIEKLLRAGLVTGKELNYLATVRHKLHTSVVQTVGYDIDNPSANEDEVETEDE